MYKNEAAFAKAFGNVLKANGAFVTRIETGSTGQGVPDMFVVYNGVDFWMELKNEPTIKYDTARDSTHTIHWRPGQKAWMLTYALHHCVKFAYTIVAGKDCFLIIPMDKHSKFEHNKVTTNAAAYVLCKSFEEVIAYFTEAAKWLEQ